MGSDFDADPQSRRPSRARDTQLRMARAPGSGIARLSAFTGRPARSNSSGFSFEHRNVCLLMELLVPSGTPTSENVAYAQMRSTTQRTAGAMASA